MRTAYFFLLAFAGWTLVFWYHYVHNIKQLCTPTVTPASIIIPESNPSITIKKQLLFKSGTYRPVIDGTSANLIDTILTKSAGHQLLQITGYYSPKEQLGLDFDLGLARAAEIKKILLNQLPEDRIEIFSDTIRNFIFYKDSLVEALTYEWVDGYTPLESANYYLLEHDTKRIQTEGFTILLDQIAERLKLSGETVIIRGHTDTGGGKEINFKIGLRNAKDIRDIFRTKGIDNKQIIPTTQGEEMPIADNETEKGKIKNRRVEIEIKERGDIK